jgi:YaiO family outer membrane protein
MRYSVLKRTNLCSIIFALLFIPVFGIAQDVNLSSDELFEQARKQAFESKNYTKAIALSKLALSKSPDYTDISVFLGRLYTWSDKVDSARYVFNTLDQRQVTDQDFFLAYASLEYWNDQYAKALELVDRGLALHPKAEDLLYLKGRINYSNNNYVEADRSISQLLVLNPRHTEARALSKNIQEYVAKNAIGINYSFTHFDKQFANDWHIVSLSYKRATSIGTVILKTNYANKFADNGLQYELEAYPRISKVFYMYVGAGYSNNVGIFPKYRTGASLYANLPKSFEAEFGYRQLYFSNSIWMYTASVGKYYQNYWFNVRTYLTPSNEDISQSYAATVRYYTKGANDYLGFVVGTGISPDDSRSNLIENYSYKLKTFKVGAEYNFSIKRSNLISLSAMYFNQEYKPKEKGNQIDLSIGYIKTF